MTWVLRFRQRRGRTIYARGDHLGWTTNPAEAKRFASLDEARAAQRGRYNKWWPGCFHPIPRVEARSRAVGKVPELAAPYCGPKHSDWTGFVS